MPAQKRQMKLGVSMIGLGYHVAAWRHPDVPADGSPNIRHSVEVAQTAERGKLDMVFLADAVGIREYDEPPFQRDVAVEVKRWAEVIEKAGIKAQ